MNSMYNLDNFVEINLYEEEGKELREKIEQILNNDSGTSEKRVSVEEKIGRDYKNKKVRLITLKDEKIPLEYRSEIFDEIKFEYVFYDGKKYYYMKLINKTRKEERNLPISNIKDIEIINDFKIEEIPYIIESYWKNKKKVLLESLIFLSFYYIL